MADQDIDITARLVNFNFSTKKMSFLQEASNPDTRIQVVARVDLALDITSADLFSYFKCPLIGFVTSKSGSSRYRLILPEITSKKNHKSRKQSRSVSQVFNIIKYSCKILKLLLERNFKTSRFPSITNKKSSWTTFCVF